MKLQEIFNQLTHGELSQVHIGGAEDGQIAEKHWPVVISHINLGLMALFKRFSIKEGNTLLTLIANQVDYPITAVDLLKVERVYTDAGKELVLNDLAESYSLRTPTTSVLQVPKKMVDGSTDIPDWLKTLTLKVMYRASHPQITIGLGYFDPERVDVDLPYAYLQALLYFVASRVHNPIGMTNEFNAGNNWAAKYEMECQRLENENLQMDRGAGNTRLASNGWV